jgi:hypothetical protein
VHLVFVSVERGDYVPGFPARSFARLVLFFGDIVVDVSLCFCSSGEGAVRPLSFLPSTRCAPFLQASFACGYRR